jgi:hypothetical protein
MYGMQQLGIGLTVAGVVSFLFPGFNGMFFERSSITAGDGQIVGAILIVGGLILIALARKSKA